MDFDFLPQRVVDSISKLKIDKLFEIRVRANAPIKCLYCLKNYYLTNNGVSSRKDNSLRMSSEELFECIRRVSEFSLYANNDKIKEGFITNKDGIRIGIAGDCVYEDGKILTIKNFTSLIIRIPHEVKDCSKDIYNKLLKTQLKNILIISPPRFGKTTILKDLIKKIDSKSQVNIMVIDERGELILTDYENVDCVKNANKNYAFSYGIRSLSPDLIVTDELLSECDFDFAKSAVNSGIKIIASMHASNICEVVNKKYFEQGIFDYYVILSNKNIGEIYKIYDKVLNEFCF